MYFKVSSIYPYIYIHTYLHTLQHTITLKIILDCYPQIFLCTNNRKEQNDLPKVFYLKNKK